MLRSETNTQAMDKKILAAARKRFKRSDFPQTWFEHGQWWIVLRDGGIFSVVDCEKEGVDYFDFEAA